MDIDALVRSVDELVEEHVLSVDDEYDGKVEAPEGLGAVRPMRANAEGFGLKGVKLSLIRSLAGPHHPPTGIGLKLALRTLDHTRVTNGAQSAGIAQGALDFAVGYVKERQQFGKHTEASWARRRAIRRRTVSSLDEPPRSRSEFGS
jgi:hypothetical protein